MAALFGASLVTQDVRFHTWDLNARRTREQKWFRDHGEQLDAAVADILARFVAPAG